MKKISKEKRKSVEHFPIRRFPIQIGEHAVAVIHLFQKCDHLEDCFEDSCFKLNHEVDRQPKVAAKQFISQLEESYNMEFLLALRDEINDEIKEHDKKYKTNFFKPY